VDFATLVRTPALMVGTSGKRIYGDGRYKTRTCDLTGVILGQTLPKGPLLLRIIPELAMTCRLLDRLLYRMVRQSAMIKQLVNSRLHLVWPEYERLLVTQSAQHRWSSCTWSCSAQSKCLRPHGHISSRGAPTRATTRRPDHRSVLELIRIIRTHWPLREIPP